MMLYKSANFVFNIYFECFYGIMSLKKGKTN